MSNLLQGKTIAIVGLGLMGGSLALALRRAGLPGEEGALIGVARREETVSQALADHIVDEATTGLAAGVRQADIIVLSTPVRTIVDQIYTLRELAQNHQLKPGVLITDMGSTKVEICAALASLPETVQAVGGHPMCGKETAGLDAAEANLYDGATYVLCPLSRTSPEAVSLAEALVDAVSAHAIRLDPVRHDRLVGAISHLPYLLSCALVAAVDNIGREDETVWQLAASGFRDTSRLASSDVRMMVDILLTNREPVLEMVQRLQAELDSIIELLQMGQPELLAGVLASVRLVRNEWVARRNPMDL
ncbi:MAG TPA: prephenate dehydrogenase [Anaerolineae bacterium]|nr:prephenate dehydrogenase [Anaerolineae bacterium]